MVEEHKMDPEILRRFDRVEDSLNVKIGNISAVQSEHGKRVVKLETFFYAALIVAALFGVGAGFGYVAYKTVTKEITQIKQGIQEANKEIESNKVSALEAIERAQKAAILSIQKSQNDVVEKTQQRIVKNVEDILGTNFKNIVEQNENLLDRLKEYEDKRVKMVRWLYFIYKEISKDNGKWQDTIKNTAERVRNDLDIKITDADKVHVRHDEVHETKE